MSSVAIMAIGLTLVIVVGEIDLSFGAMYGLGVNTLAALWVARGVPIYLAIPISLLIAAAVGLFNGFLVTTLKIPSFIVTLGSYNLLYGLSLWVSNSGTFNPNYPALGSGPTAGPVRFLHRSHAQLRQVPDLRLKCSGCLSLRSSSAFFCIARCSVSD